MAEHVQAALDQMVAPLQDLQERGVFSQEEIHAIIDRRRNSEYDMRRRQPRKADFLRYLQAEQDLEQLRKLRVKRLRREREDHKEGYEQQQTKSIGDKHIIQHIHLLWTRTLRKFRADKALYLQYADFCKSTASYKRLSRLYGEALSVFPRETGLWIEAASHECFQAGSVQNARVILQRGLRINPAAQDLWLQSFALELHFVEKMRGRRAVLAGQDGDDAAKKTLQEEESSDSDHYRIAILVYDNAIKAVSDDVAFRLQFLDQCRLFSETSALEEHIIESIQRDCEDKPEAWIARAMHQWEKLKHTGDEEMEGFMRTGAIGEEEEEDDDDNEPKRKRHKSSDTDSGEKDTADPVLAMIKEATQKLQSEDMYLQAIRFLGSYLDQRVHDGTAAQDWLSTCREQLDALFGAASASNFYCSALALEHADYLVQCGKTKEAIDVVKAYAESSEKTEATVWTFWAGLVSPSSGERAIAILQRALERIPMGSSDHMVVLLQLFGAKLKAGDSEADDLSEMFQRIILLAPGFIEMKDIEHPTFGIESISKACLRYLRSAVETKEIEDVRRVYSLVLFQSTCAELLAAKDPASMQAFVDESIEDETNVPTKSDGQRLRRLYDSAIKLFPGTPAENEYRQRRDDFIHSGTTSTARRSEIALPSLDVNDHDSFAKAYDECQVVHLPNVARNGPSKLTWKDIGELFHRLNSSDKESWCIETKTAATMSARDFLRPNITNERAYCSFLIQKDKVLYDETLSRLPVQHLGSVQWSYEPALWVFFGRNTPESAEDLEGRPEHTDSVTHDGTWHFQLSGTKIWFFPLLLDQLQQRFPDKKVFEKTKKSFRIECKEGDVIVVNTRLWFHRTVIPPQREPCVSYARDFRFSHQKIDDDAGGMTNLDGLYATEDIDEGTILFRETEMPNCELHRSNINPNCEVVELEDGSSAVVSTRGIAAGEFFSVPESSDDDESSIDSAGEG